MRAHSTVSVTASLQPALSAHSGQRFGLRYTMRITCVVAVSARVLSGDSGVTAGVPCGCGLEMIFERVPTLRAPSRALPCSAEGGTVPWVSRGPRRRVGEVPKGQAKGEPDNMEHSEPEDLRGLCAVHSEAQGCVNASQ
jgi:hypothetical protein